MLYSQYETTTDTHFDDFQCASWKHVYQSTSETRVMSLIADIILVLHFCVVIFITFGFFLIPIGYKFGWDWVTNTQLRIFHIGMMMFITLETLLGMTCPLTSIENRFRGIYQSKSFIGIFRPNFSSFYTIYF